MAAAKKKTAPGGMKYSEKKGKKVKVDPKRSAAAMKAAKKRKRTFSATHRAAISAGRLKALRTGKNRFGKKIRKQGRPVGSKNRPGSMKPGPKPGTKFGPRKKKAGAKKSVKKTEGKKRGRPAGVKKKVKVEAPKKRGRSAKVEAPKRGRPAKVEAPKRGRPAGKKSAMKPEMKVNRAKGKGLRAA